MAMGLALLGRSRRADGVVLGVVHLLGAAVGGAVIAVALSLGGAAFELAKVRPLVLLVAAAGTVWIALVRSQATLGLNRQVPRQWLQRMHPARAYALWGVLLGSGVATLIPYSSAVLLHAAQATAPVGGAAAAGVLFGVTRQGLALVEAAAQPDIMRISNLLVRLRTVARRLNVAVTLTAGVALLAASIPHAL
jgi:hypothetical protein